MKLLLKLGVSLAVLYFFFRNLDFAELAALFGRLDLPTLVLALSLLSLSTVLAATRWRVISLEARGKTPRLLFFLRSYYRSAFLNQGLPSTLGGDAMRVIDLGQAIGSRREAFGTVLFDRVIGLSGLLVINLLMFPVGLSLFPLPLALAVAGVSLAGLIAVAVALRLPWDRVSHRNRMLNLAADLSLFGRRVLAHPRGFALQCAITLAVHFSALLAMFVLARKFGVEVDLLTQLAIQPSVIIVAMLPISLAGWGVREGSMVALFAAIGVAAPAVIATSLSFGLLVLVSTLPGLVFLIGRSMPAHLPESGVPIESPPPK
jgi:glycosyltransferase 2 family protein